MSALARFEITGDATPGRTRTAGLLDGLAATLIAMIVTPQPVLRQVFVQAAGPVAGIVLFVSVLLLLSLAVLGVYLAFAAVTWGRSPAMYLLDLGLEAQTKPTMGEAVRWSLGWMLAFVPALLGVASTCHPTTGLPARLSGLPTRSTAPAAGE